MQLHLKKRIILSISLRVCLSGVTLTVLHRNGLIDSMNTSPASGRHRSVNAYVRRAEKAAEVPNVQ